MKLKRERERGTPCRGLEVKERERASGRGDEEEMKRE